MKAAKRGPDDVDDPATMTEAVRMRARYNIESDQFTDPETGFVYDSYGHRIDRPKDEATAETGGMTFGQALNLLQGGKLLRRKGWNGKGMWLIYVPGSSIVTKEGTPYAKALGTNYAVDINPHIDMLTATGEMQPGWLASQTDMLAEDWEVVT